MPFRSAIALNGPDHERGIAAKFRTRGEALSILLKGYDTASDTDIPRLRASSKRDTVVRRGRNDMKKAWFKAIRVGGRGLPHGKP